MGPFFFSRSATPRVACVSGRSNLRFIATSPSQVNCAAFAGQGEQSLQFVPLCPSIYNPRFMDLGLKNRVALVAASSQGLGLATAEAFAAEGCRLAMCARNQQALAHRAENIRKQHNVEVFTDAFDVTDASAVSAFVKAVVDKFGTVDICVTNAGGPPAKGFLAATIEDWRRAIDANF